MKLTGKKITVIYPEEREEKPREMMFAKKWSQGEIDLSQIEADLKNIIGVFDSLQKGGSKYEVNEAKLTVGLMKGEDDKLHASVAANLLSLIKGSVGGEISETINENKLFEITIKRRVE